jgi:hypothetical protein
MHQLQRSASFVREILLDFQPFWDVSQEGFILQKSRFGKKIILTWSNFCRNSIIGASNALSYNTSSSASDGFLRIWE